MIWELKKWSLCLYPKRNPPPPHTAQQQVALKDHILSHVCCYLFIIKPLLHFQSVPGALPLMQQRSCQFRNNFLSLLFQGSLDRQAKLKITCSNRCVLAKLDALGEGFDQPLQNAKEKITSENLKTRELQNQGTAQEMNERMKDHLRNCQPGFTIGFDNIDFEIPRKNITLGKKNQDLHWVNHLMFGNRVLGICCPMMPQDRSANSVKYDILTERQ